MSRTGSWMAVRVDLANDGPAFTGELRIVGGTQGRTRFAVPVDLPTTSRKAYTLHAQSPAFGGTLEVALVADEKVVTKRTIAFALHDTGQLVVGVVAERPGPLVAALSRLRDPSGPQPAVVQLTPADLPDRPEAWSALDRLVWQDVDAGRLSAEQAAALRTWLAGGGRLTIVGGTGGLGLLAGFSDELLPYRPTATLDVEPAALQGMLGGTLPRGAEMLPALAGELATGARALALSGDRTIAADRPFGSGAVTLPGNRPGHAVACREHRRRRALGDRRPDARDLPRPAVHRRRRDDRVRPRHAARACPAARRGPPDPADRLHHPDRAGELPGPAPPRPPGVGLGDHAPAGGGVHRRRVRDRGHAPRHRRHRQPGGRRACRAGHRRRAGRRLPRRLLAESQLLRHQHPGRRAALGPLQRRGLRPVGRAGPRPRAGRSRPSPPARGRLRDPAGGARRSPGDHSPHRGRPAPRGRPRRGNHPQRLVPGAPQAGRGPRDRRPRAGRHRPRGDGQGRPAGRPRRARAPALRADLRPAAVGPGRQSHGQTSCGTRSGASWWTA